MSAVLETLPLGKPETPLRRFAREFFRSPVATGSFAALMIIVALALFAPLLSPQNPYDLAKVTVMDARLAPGATGSGGFLMWLGADGAGRDMWSAILYGLRISLGVGVASGARSSTACASASASAWPPAWWRSRSAPRSAC
jgi:peptide/nickel transport system permease protein